jgi:hypothetical protein
MAPLSSPDGQTAVCSTHGGRYQILFTRYPTVGLVTVAPAAQKPRGYPSPVAQVSSPMPGSNEAYAANLVDAFGGPEPLTVQCARHPDVQAVTYCQTCRTPVCATCVFIFPGGFQLCPTCAANPVPKMAPKRKGLMWWSIGLAIWSILGLIVMFVALTQMHERGQAEAIGGAMYLLSLLPALIGLALGVSTFDRRLATPGVVWFGIIGNGLVLVIWLLLMVVGMMR